MTNDEPTLRDVLCADCGGLLRLPDVPVPAALLRWCLCDLDELLGEQQAKETIGFTKQAAKTGKRKG